MVRIPGSSIVLREMFVQLPPKLYLYSPLVQKVSSTEPLGSMKQNLRLRNSTLKNNHMVIYLGISHHFINQKTDTTILNPVISPKFRVARYYPIFTAII